MVLTNGVLTNGVLTTGDVTEASFRERAHQLIPGGSHTYSRGDDQFPAQAPAAFSRGKGGRVVDLAGREYVDWGMGINNVLIGHAEDSIDNEAIAAIRHGQAFSRPTMLEVTAAEAYLPLFPSMDMIKFAKNGSDANTAALRLARAITGRDLVAFDTTAPFLSIHDWFIGTTPMGAGVPQAVRDLSVGFAFNDTASVDRLFDEHGPRLAMVALEVCRDRRPSAGFLEHLRRRCSDHGTLLLFDEIVTAFRYGLNGAYTLFGVTPDLLSIGKAMANGYALTAILGKREYMERGGLRHDRERVFFLSTTNGPEQSALAAGIATAAFYQAADVVGHLYQTGQAIIDGLRAAARRHGVAEQVDAASDFGCRPAPVYRDRDGKPSPAFRALFLQELLRRSVFMPWVCPCFRHTSSEIDQTLEAFDGACAIYARALEGGVERFLVGPPTKPVFRTHN